MEDSVITVISRAGGWPKRKANRRTKLDDDDDQRERRELLRELIANRLELYLETVRY